MSDCKRIAQELKRSGVNKKGSWYTAKFSASYHEFAECHKTTILPARVRHPKDRSSTEGSGGFASTWIIAGLHKEQFFSVEDLNNAVAEKLGTCRCIDATATPSLPAQRAKGILSACALGYEAVQRDLDTRLPK